MPPNEPNNGNNRVTLAVLGTRLEYAIGLIEEAKDDGKEQDKRIRANELAIATHTEQIRNRSAIALALQAIGTGLGIVWK